MKKKLHYLIAIFCLICMHSFSQTTWHVSTTGDDITGDGSEGAPWGTIKGAIAKEVVWDTHIIQLADGVYTEKEIDVNKGITIMGTSANGTIVQATADKPDGEGTDASIDKRVFKIIGGFSVEIKNLTVRNGNVNGQSGAAIYITWNCTATIENCNFFDNYSNWNAGAINIEGTGIIKNSSFAFNNGGNGGAIGAAGDTKFFTMENCTLYSNKANNEGGALWLGVGVTASLNNNTIVDNSTKNGGNRKGMYFNGGATISQFTNNLVLNTENGGIDFGHNWENGGAYNALEGAVANNNIVSQMWYDEINNEPNSITGLANVTKALIDFGAFQDNGNGVSSLAISTSSIAINKGDAATATTTDAHGNIRVGNPDVGAFENQTPLSTTSFELEGITLAPNPSNGFITLKNMNISSFNLDVYGVTGALVYSAKQSNMEIQLPQNINGLVFIKISTPNSTKVFKHIIK